MPVEALAKTGEGEKGGWSVGGHTAELDSGSTFFGVLGQGLAVAVALIGYPVMCAYGLPAVLMVSVAVNRSAEPQQFASGVP